MEFNKKTVESSAQTFSEYFNEHSKLLQGMSHRSYIENMIEPTQNQLLTASVSFDIHTQNMNFIEISEEDKILLSKIDGGFVEIDRFRKMNDDLIARVRKVVVSIRDLLRDYLKTTQKELAVEAEIRILNTHISDSNRDLQEMGSFVSLDDFPYLVNGFPVSASKARDTMNQQISRLTSEIEVLEVDLAPILRTIEDIEAKFETCTDELDSIERAIWDLEYDFDAYKQSSSEQFDDLLKENMDNLNPTFKWIDFYEFEYAKDHTNDLYKVLVDLAAELNSRLSDAKSFDVALLLNHPKEAEEVRLFIEKIAQSKMIIDLMIATASELQIQIEELEDIEK